MERNLDKFYDNEFYSRNFEGMSKSAAVVLGILFKHYNPQSIIDEVVPEGHG